MVNHLNMYALQTDLVAGGLSTMKPATLTMNKITMFANMMAICGGSAAPVCERCSFCPQA